MWSATSCPEGSSSRAPRVRLRSISEGRLPPISGGSAASGSASLVSISRVCWRASDPAPATSKNRAHSIVQNGGRIRNPPKCCSRVAGSSTEVDRKVGSGPTSVLSLYRPRIWECPKR